NYPQHELLVSTGWVVENGKEPNGQIGGVDVDTNAYNEGHIPGAIGWAGNTQLSDTIRRDILSKDALESLLSESGIANDSTVVLYGDNNNWFAAWALWQLKLYVHKDVRMVNGGRKKWLVEGRELSTAVSKYPQSSYRASAPDLSLRAFLPQAQIASREASAVLVGVRSPQEFTGEILAPADLP